MYYHKKYMENAVEKMQLQSEFVFSCLFLIIIYSTILLKLFYNFIIVSLIFS